MYQALGREIFDQRLDHVQFQPGAAARVGTIVKRYFGTEPAATPTRLVALPRHSRNPPSPHKT
jgi:hypothetical protein